MFSLIGCRAEARSRTQIIARTLLASVILLGVAMALNAQPVLVETMVEAGNFKPFAAAAGCSATSPEFHNLPAVATTDPAFVTVPAGCKNTVEDWVSNVGNAPTDGSPVIKIFNFAPGTRAVTVIAANGFTAAPGNIAKPAANGWTCNAPPHLDSLTCTRADVLAAGQHYPAIIITVIVESAFLIPPVLNISSTVSGGGMVGQNGAFDAVNTFPGPSQLCKFTRVYERYDDSAIFGWVTVPVCTATRFVLATVPPNQKGEVDGSIYSTPFAFYFFLDSLHTLLEPFFSATTVLSGGLTSNSPACLTSGTPPADPGGCTFDGNELVVAPDVDIQSKGVTLLNTFGVFVKK